MICAPAKAAARFLEPPPLAGRYTCRHPAARALSKSLRPTVKGKRQTSAIAFHLARVR